MFSSEFGPEIGWFLGSEKCPEIGPEIGWFFGSEKCPEIDPEIGWFLGSEKCPEIGPEIGRFLGVKMPRNWTVFREGSATFRNPFAEAGLRRVLKLV